MIIAYHQEVTYQRRETTTTTKKLEETKRKNEEKLTYSLLANTNTTKTCPQCMRQEQIKGDTNRTDKKNEFNGLPNDTWYTQRKGDGEVQGQISFVSTEELEIVPLERFKPIKLQQCQDNLNILPRKVLVFKEMIIVFK